jgi:predicted SnoaL-like aldol condensation-catalyzing enzyme
MGRKLDNVVRFLDTTINGGRLAEALAMYTAIPSGGDAAVLLRRLRDRLVTGYRPLIDRYDRRFVRPMRGFEDGSRVVVHSFQTFGYRAIERVVFDVFDTDRSDRITGHTSVTTPLVTTTTGLSQIDGPWLLDDLSATEANKRVIRSYLTVDPDDRWPRATLLSTDYADHTVRLTHDHDADGRASRLGQPDILGCGNFVAALSTSATSTGIALTCDLYRLAAGRIAERWGVVAAEPVVISGRVRRVSRNESPAASRWTTVEATDQRSMAKEIGLPDGPRKHARTQPPGLRATSEKDHRAPDVLAPPASTDRSTRTAGHGHS